MRIKLAITLVSSILLTPAVFPQISGFTLDRKENTVLVTFNTPRGMPAPTVTGAPYSADRVLEHATTLADGTHVSQAPSVQHIVRDSQGRTRTERPLLVLGDPNAWTLSVSEIRDPLDGFYYILDEQNRIAHRFATPPAPPQAEVTKPSGPPTPQATAPPRPVSDGRHADNVVEKLGSQWIEGIIAEGQRVTTTWPAGTQGNDRPIVSIFEAWVSPDLHVEVRTKSIDPRSGETTIRLTNLTRTEPDPGLFLPPPDYTIVDEKRSFTMTVTRH
jgi:hypothetical protein